MNSKGLWGKLGAGLARTRMLMMTNVGDIIRTQPKVGEEFLNGLEESLLAADVGVHTVMELMEAVRERAKSAPTADEVLSVLKDEMLRILDGAPRPADPPAGVLKVVLVIGVNGVGKTTTIGKAAFNLGNQGKKVIVAAADTFRAAAIEQIESWCSSAGADLIRHREGADPAAIVYDAIHAARARKADILLVDTAGRLHTKSNLMNELTKIRRVAVRESPEAVHEGWLILDATTGQNGLSQAKEFFETAQIGAVVLTKLDGSAKGGIALSIVKELKIPILFVGVGEGLDDLIEFEPRAYVEAMFA